MPATAWSRCSHSWKAEKISFRATIFAAAADASGQSLPLKAYEPTIEMRDRKSRSVFIEATYSVETGEAERIAVDWTAKGGSGGTSRKSPITPLVVAQLC